MSNTEIHSVNIQKTLELDNQISQKESRERTDDIPMAAGICDNSLLSFSYETKHPSRLKYDDRIFNIILFINIFLPGFGTIIAAIGWGNTCKIKDRTNELIFRGIIQIFTIIFLVGWIQAILDSINYFKYSPYD